MAEAKNIPGGVPVKSFRSYADWEAWLAKNHASSHGLWLKLAKKGSGQKSVTYDEAVEAALCYGWIDGQKKPFDDRFWLQKFTPRGPKSIWAKRNREKAEKLMESGRMTCRRESDRSRTTRRTLGCCLRLSSIGGGAFRSAKGA